MRRETKRGRGGPQPGSGRKPLPLAKKQRNRVMLNLTDDEYMALIAAAGNEPAAAFARTIVLRYLARRRK